MLIIVGEKRNVLCLDALLCWHYEIFTPEQDKIILMVLSIKTERTLNVNASEPVSAQPRSITRVIHIGAEGDINTINTTKESCSRTKSFTNSKFQLIC